jgi:hypothetical protein
VVSDAQVSSLPQWGKCAQYKLLDYQSIQSFFSVKELHFVGKFIDQGS